MKPSITWLCLALFLLAGQAEARRITGGKPMAPRGPQINYQTLQSHRAQEQSSYQSGYYEQQFQAEVRRGRSVNNLVESRNGAPPVYPLNYGSLRQSVLDAAQNPPSEYNPFKVKPEYGSQPSSRPRSRYPTEGAKTPVKLF